jgi:hypothetical protein
MIVAPVSVNQKLVDRPIGDKPPPDERKSCSGNAEQQTFVKSFR